EITKLGMTLGMDLPFLRYSREQELEAGMMAVRLIAEARYDPNALRTLLEKINESQSGDAPRARGFVFNHPQSSTLSPEIADQIDHPPTSTRPARAGSEFRAFRSALLKLPGPASKSSATTDTDSDSSNLPNVFTHPMEYYRLNYPTGWQVARTGLGGA